MKSALLSIIVLSILGIVAVGWYLYSQTGPSQTDLTPAVTPTPETVSAPSPGPISLKGQLICLPHLNQNGPQTAECAFGLKDDSGRYFALRDADPAYQNISGIPTNTSIEVQGNFAPQQDTKYQSMGIIEVTKITQISKDIPTKYITTVDWPPKVNTLNQPFVCNEAGSETDRAGQTKKVVINDRTYCVTKVTDGAAGSVYTQYAYAVAEENRTRIFTFSLRFVQCGNYSEPEKTACETERRTFNIDNFMDQYIQNIS